MNNYKATLRVALSLLLLAIVAGSCKKKNNGPTMGTFWFHLHTNIDTNEVDDTAALYRDSAGRHFSLSVAQFYVSNVTLHNVLGSSYTISNAYVLKSIDSEEYLVGNAPAGTYDGVSFTVGLPPSVNGLSPTAFTNTGYISNSSMWFGNATDGYMYLKIQGMADTTATQSGTALVPFDYEIGKIIPVGGSDQALKTITMPTRSGVLKPYILSAGSTTFIHLYCDYGKLLQGINFKTQDKTDTHSLLYPDVSSNILGNLPNMFRYEE